MGRLLRLRLGLRFKLNLVIGTVIVGSVFLFDGVSIVHERQFLIDQKAHEIENIAEQLSWMIQHSPGDSLSELTARYEQGLNDRGNGTYRVTLINARSEIVASANPRLIGAILNERKAWQGYEKISTNDPEEILVHGTTGMLAALPIEVRSESGQSSSAITILILNSLDDVREKLSVSLLTHSLHLIVAGLTIVLLVNTALSRFVLKPVSAVLSDMSRMQKGELASDLPVRSSDEIGELTRGYNSLGRNLEASVFRLVRAEKLASVALVAIHLNRELRKPIEAIRSSTELLCRRNIFDAESARAAGRIFDQTDNIAAISEKFNHDFSNYCQDSDGRAHPGADTAAQPSAPKEAADRSNVLDDPMLGTGNAAKRKVKS